MALGVEPMALGPFHFLLCLVYPFSSAKWASYTVPSLTEEEDSSPFLLWQKQFSGCRSLCAPHPSVEDNVFKKVLCSKPAVDFNLSWLTQGLPFFATRPLPPALTCTACLLWLSPRIHSFSAHILFPVLLISCLTCFGSFSSDFLEAEEINWRGIEGRDELRMWLLLVGILHFLFCSSVPGVVSFRGTHR